MWKREQRSGEVPAPEIRVKSSEKQVEQCDSGLEKRSEVHAEIADWSGATPGRLLIHGWEVGRRRVGTRGDAPDLPELPPKRKANAGKNVVAKINFETRR